jgi:type IV secretion system protein VirB9
MGDGKAWAMNVTKSGILLKPAEAKPDTNFMVVTNFRHYTFSLVTAKKNQATTWVLSFDYPDTRARVAEQQTEKRDAEQVEISALTQSPKAPRKNTDYFMRGDVDLAPTALWDDGRFTYFQYATTRMLPAGIYTILPDGTEAVTNFHMDGDTMVVHETAKQFILRTGKAVLGIRNDGFSPARDYNASGTTVPGTVRVVKDK